MSGAQSALARATRCQSSSTAILVTSLSSLPRRENFHVRRAREICRDLGRMHDVVAAHQQHRNVAMPHEFLGYAECETAAEHAPVETRQLYRVDVGSVLVDLTKELVAQHKLFV
jgi:hypothetical protein